MLSLGCDGKHFFRMVETKKRWRSTICEENNRNVINKSLLLTYLYLVIYILLSSGVILYNKPEKEFCPPMSEIMEHLTSLLQKVETGKSISEDGTKLDTFERSFPSTHTCFFSSPIVSHLSV